MRFFILFSTLSIIAFTEEIPHEIFSWETLEFEWPCQEARETAIRWGKYIPENNLIYNLAVWKDKLFITTPRFKKGAAATVSFINLSGKHEKSPKLCPYPSWEANEEPETEGITDDSQLVSAEGIQVDDCDRLWVLDWGYVGLDPWAERVNVADPALVIFDLTCDKLVRRFTLKKTDYKEDSRFNGLALETTKSGDTVAYISDPFGHGLIVYSFDQNESWRIQHNYFYPDPFQGYFKFSSQDVAMPVGIYGISLSPIQHDGYRTVYFHTIASSTQFAVSSKVLMNATYANSVEAYNEFKVIGDRGPDSASLSSELDQETGIIYYATIAKHTFSCWNTALEANADNFKTIVGGDQLYPYDVDIDEEANLWLLSSDIPGFVSDKQKCGETHYRILKLCQEEASKTCGTCESKPKNHAKSKKEQHKKSEQLELKNSETVNPHSKSKSKSKSLFSNPLEMFQSLIKH